MCVSFHVPELGLVLPSSTWTIHTYSDVFPAFQIRDTSSVSQYVN